MASFYLFLLFLRILLVFAPQVGYIHPDEFLQSVDILAGKFLNVKCNPPWEFNATFPVRSIALPYFTTGLCYKYLKAFDNLTSEYLFPLNLTLLTPYIILITPRILMCIFSFVIDYCLYKICFNNNQNYKSRLVILSSSYVMLVYATRTFSNSMELVLFSILLYYVCESVTFSNKVLRKKRGDTIIPQAEMSLSYHKFMMSSDMYRNCMCISTITVIGFFNRPTFLGYAAMPVLFWLCRRVNNNNRLGCKTVTVSQFFKRILVLVVCAIPTLIFIVSVDSFFYGRITWRKLGVLDVSISSFVFTPLNFLIYNTNASNLAQHGLHPRFLHILVNIPLLFNVLGMFALIMPVKYAFFSCKKQFHLLPSVNSIRCLMTLSFIVPTALLSIFPHQEPRFLIPILFPLAYLHADDIYLERDSTLAEAKARLHDQGSAARSSITTQHGCLSLWLIVNAVMTIFFGFFHQGGVYQATAHLSQHMRLTPSTIDFHVVTSHIYSVPESFFMQKSSSRWVHLYEEGSKDLEQLKVLLNKILTTTDVNQKRNKKVYLLIPSSLAYKLNYFTDKDNLSFSLLESFFPHISTEVFPDLTTFYTDWRNFWKLFRLNMYQVTVDKI